MKFYHMAKKLSKFMMFIFNIRAEDAHNMPTQGPVVLCSNHRANYDPVLLGTVVPRQLYFMAKVELFKIPLFNKLITVLGAFPVKRGAGDKEAIRTAVRILERGDILAMFPEGHRNKLGGDPKTFKSGAALLAFKTGAKIIPAAVICKGKMHFFKRKVIKIGKPISPGELGFTDGSTENLRAVSERIRQEVAALIGGRA